MDKKQRLLKRYEGQLKQKKNILSRQGLHIKDNQIQFNDSVSSQQDESQQKQKKRIQSDDQNEDDNEDNKLIIEQKKSKRISKNIRKIFGLKKTQDNYDFLNAIKIQGLSQKQLDQYLKNNKYALQLDNKKQRKQKKKKQKQQQSLIKLQENIQQSSSSDLEIPQQARTIYRNKDGTIRQYSQAKQKQIKQKQILQRLGQWQKGMKKQQYQQQQRIDIWDDPARRWQSKIKHPLACKYEGYANRFNIKPGYRWDGVIRGNGFQNKYLQQINLRKVKQQQDNRDYLKNL